MWRKSALSVGSRFWQRVLARIGPTSAATIARALGFAASTRVIRIDTTTNADTFCLSVPSPHAFAVNDGLLVHNCIRYFIASRPPAPPLELPASAGTFAGARQQLRRERQGRVR